MREQPNNNRSNRPSRPTPPADAADTLNVVKFVTSTPPGQQPAENQPAAGVEQPAAGAEQPAANVADPTQPSNGLVTMASPDFGIQAFLYWRPEVAARDLQLVNDIKFRTKD